MKDCAEFRARGSPERDGGRPSPRKIGEAASLLGCGSEVFDVVPATADVVPGTGPDGRGLDRRQAVGRSLPAVRELAEKSTMPPYGPVFGPRSTG
jgi:hypothetical protein